MKEKKLLRKSVPQFKSAFEDDDEENVYRNQPPKRDNKSSKTPVLDNFSRDLTKMAEEGKIDPIVGREKEIERVCQILSRRKKNNPILIGDPGTGKSSVAEGLAQRIIQKRVPRVLYNKKICTLDLASMVAGTKYRGQFEERVKALMQELEKNPNIILFIDEIHTIIGAGGAAGSIDASNMFKPALARGELQIIGATTLDEYRKYVEKDGALERRFQKVLVKPATEEESLEILNNIKSHYESYHNVNFTDDAIKACVKLTSRFMTDRHLPDKAIDAMDEAGSRVNISNIEVPSVITDIENKLIEIKLQKDSVIKSQKYEEAAKLRDVEKQLKQNLDTAQAKWEEEQKMNRKKVNEEDVAEVVSMMTGIPLQKVSQKENERLSKMGEVISGKVIGQNEAVTKIVKAIQRGRVGMKDPNKPLFSGILIGNSGVGKTELAKQISKYMFETEDSLIRIDMSEYSEKISINRIIGSPQGYVGYEDSNILDKIRRKPYSVVLFDEIEKAHGDVFNLFLQMLDDGHMTDSHGRTVSFKNTVILMTSNVGTRVVKDFGAGIGFNTKSKSETKEDDVKSILEKELKKKFPPEFINRLDEIIYFRDLGKEDILKIVDLELNKSIKRAKELGFEVTIDETMKSHLMEVGYDSQYGARPMKRAIQRWVDDNITQFIIDESPKEGTKIDLSYNKEEDKGVVNVLDDKKKRTKKTLGE